MSLAPATRFVVIGNPEQKRIALFQAALQRRGQPRARVVAYRDLLERDDCHLDGDEILRFESPGQDGEVEKRLIALGASEQEEEFPAAPGITPIEALALASERGRILYPRQWFLGFRGLLRRLRAIPRVRWMNHPDDIATMFDKPHCHRRLATAGVPVPLALGTCRSFEELHTRMAEARRTRVFVKLASGSSASGVVALATDGRRLLAQTSAEMVRDGDGLRLYNSRRIRRYDDLQDIKALIDHLAADGIHVEEWIPKAGALGKTFDLRVVMIAGEPRHIVVRLSESPLTNLHLLNARRDIAAIRHVIPEENWAAAMASCRRAAAIFPRSHYCGLDLLFAPGYRRHAVLEINAFGDLLPGSMWQGMDTYDAELQFWPQASGARGQ